MSIARHHNEWLKLVETSGPFLSLPVLMRAFPQGLEPHDSDLAQRLRLAYDEWEEARQPHRETSPLHRAWVLFVLREVLQFQEDQILAGQSLPQALKAVIPEHGETLRPDFAILDPGNGKPRLLIQFLPPAQDLERPVPGRFWKASPATRMMELLHATGCLLGLVTNGERWMLVFAQVGESTGYASWYATLWLEERLTLQAFRSLLSAPRFFALAANETPEALLLESLANQQEVTEQLGYQVRAAVEVLIDALDRADRDQQRGLLRSVTEAGLYEASLSVMMRLVFLFSAEEQDLLPLVDECYSRNYAVSTLQAQLRESADQLGEEVLERRFDAWCRLLAAFRAVHGGVEHDLLSLPPYGGHLFDPDRFPFLEGRPAGTHWQATQAYPLPVNNRTVLHLLEALQFLQVKVPGGGPAERRRLSFRALDIEQIGHVYEGLLDHTAKRAAEIVLGLAGTKDKEPEVLLSELERLRDKGPDALVAWLKEETGRSEAALRRLLDNPPLDLDEVRFRTACGNDDPLWRRIRPFAGLVRANSYGYPVVILPGSLYMTAGADRRTTGTQYTPRALTGPIVQYTLEPLVYVGPAEGKPREEWTLRSPAELLRLKICDIACGSGAFLMETCRYLAERLVEAWDRIEQQHPGRVRITPEGKISTGDPSELLLPKETTERFIYARRLIAQRCLYGVDKNPLAVEMAKLSLWLLTLDKNKPFTFLDHAIKCGDSLLGLTRQEQIEAFDFQPQPAEEKQIGFWKSASKVLFEQALDRRRRLEASPVMTVTDLEQKEELLRQAEEATSLVRLMCDLLTGAAIATATGRPPQPGDAFSQKRVELWRALQQTYHYDDNVESWRDALLRMKPEADRLLNEGNPPAAPARRTFHWPIEFPEVFVDGSGFDALVGNPPFMGGQKITGALGTSYRDCLVGYLASGKRGSADLCAYFFLRAWELLAPHGGFGLLATNTIAQGDTREVALDQLIERGAVLPRAVPSRKWPGQANLEVAHVWLRRGQWDGPFVLDEQPVHGITSQLTPPGEVRGKPHCLAANADRSFQGSIVLGMGFVLTPEEAQRLLEKDPRNRDVLFPYLNGEDLNSRPDQSPSRWVINFHDWPLERAMEYPDCFAIVEGNVKPEREKNKRKVRRERWWQFAERASELYATVAGMQRVLVTARVSAHHFFHFAPPGFVYADRLVVLALPDDASFACISCSLHDAWAHRPGSTTHETRNTYFPETGFETFPFPESLAALDTIGERYYTHRRQIMLARQQGLTATYNRLHNPDESAEDIRTLRALHIEMDHAVAAAYGWTDLILGHNSHQTKQGIRYTIAEAARCTILDRLLKLNHERYAAELASGLHEKGAKAKKTRKKGETEHVRTLFS